MTQKMVSVYMIGRVIRVSVIPGRGGVEQMDFPPENFEGFERVMAALRSSRTISDTEWANAHKKWWECASFLARPVVVMDDIRWGELGMAAVVGMVVGEVIRFIFVGG